MRIAYVITAPMSADRLLRGQLRFFRERGHEVELITGPGEQVARVAAREGVRAHTIPIEREIDPAADLRALAALTKLLRRLRPQLVNVSTPKAGLLGGLAAVAARIPARIYVLRGLRVETTRGAKRAVLTSTERIACACAQRVVCVSESLREEAIRLRLVSREKTVVIGAGSSNGIVPVPIDPKLDRAALRRSLGLAENAYVIGFVGRLVRDKGIVELVEAYRSIRARRDDVELLVVGGYEEGDPLPAEARGALETLPGIARPGFVDEPSQLYAAMDLLALPSHREGFPNTPLEAAAVGLPVVTSDATGAVDAVVDGETGLIVPVGEPRALEAALTRLIEVPALARTLGAAGKARVFRDFAPERIWEGLAALYEELHAGHHARR